jgi:hypothetical protein
MSPDPALRFSFSAAPIRVAQPTELVAGLPALFGFRPRHSLFFLALDGPRGRLGFRARADLTGPADIEQAVDQLVIAAKDQPRLVGGGHGTQRRRGAGRRVGAGPGRRLRERHVEVVDALRLDDHRFWSLLCDSRSCCPPQGRPYDTSASRLVAEAVGVGQRIVTDRSELAAEFGAPDVSTARRIRAECDRIRAGLVDAYGVDPADAGARPHVGVLRAGATAVKS